MEKFTGYLGIVDKNGKMFVYKESPALMNQIKSGKITDTYLFKKPMDANGKWLWFSEVPELNNSNEVWDLAKGETSSFSIISAFNIKPAEDWTKSLQECGL